MPSAKQVAEIQFTTSGRVPSVELNVPHGTQLPDLAKTLVTISREIGSKISPRGCQACTSGYDLIIRERFENVVQVNLEDGQLMR